MRLSTTLRVGAALAAAGLALTACGESSDSGSGDNADAGSGGYIQVAENPEFEQGTTMAKLAEAGEVTVGTKQDQPMFGTKNLEGNYQGFDVEIAKIIAGAMGIEPGSVNFTATPSKIREQVIQQDKVEYVVATYTIKPSRAEKVSFAGPYYNAGQQIMVSKDNTEITGLESLQNSDAKVCTASGSTSFDNLKKEMSTDRITLFDTYSKCVDAMKNGNVSAMSTDNAILLGLIDENEGEFKMVGEPFSDEPYGVGITKNDTAFCEFINKTLQEAVDSGAYEEAWQKTAGQVVDETPKLPELNECV